MRQSFVKVFVFIGLFFILNFLVGAVLERPKEILIHKKRFDAYWRWKEFYELPAHSLDLVFLGSSHCYRSFDSKNFDQPLNINTFNMGSSAQSPLTSYYILKEVLKTQKPKVLVYEVYWQMFQQKDQFSNASYNFEFMRWSKNKLEFFWHGFSWKEKCLFLVPSQRYKFNLEDTIRSFCGKEVAFEKDSVYQAKGYVASTAVASLDELRKQNQFKNYKFNEKEILPIHIECLKKIIALCRREGVQVVFVTAPLPPASLKLVGDYQKIHRFFEAFFKMYDVPYIDYNVLEAYAMFTDLDFKDDDHLNNVGVKKMNEHFSQQLKVYLGN